MNLPPSFGVDRFVVIFFCGYADAPIVRPTKSLDLAPGTDPPPYSAYLTDIGISPWETYITSSTNLCMVGRTMTTREILNIITGTFTNADILLTWII